eukprot:scaffold2173_cov416-Prasinococcus_capsulatus_cf.AAC.11
MSIFSGLQCCRREVTDTPSHYEPDRLPARVVCTAFQTWHDRACPAAGSGAQAGGLQIVCVPTLRVCRPLYRSFHSVPSRVNGRSCSSRLRARSAGVTDTASVTQRET